MTQTDLALGLEEQVPKEPPTYLRAAKVANLLAILANICGGVVAFLLQDDEADEPPPAERPIEYLQPSVYAFGIWLVIYAGELLFGFWQCRQNPPAADEERLQAIKAVSLPWCVAHAITIVWGFLPTIFMRALALVGVAVSLGFAHGIVAPLDKGPAFYCMTAPITLHFGWATAAALVSLNTAMAYWTQDVAANFAFLVACLLVAGVAGAFFALRRRSALLAGTVAWAIVAVGIEHLFPISDERLTRYTEDFAGFGGRYLVAGAELALGVALVAVAVFVQRQKAS